MLFIIFHFALCCKSAPGSLLPVTVFDKHSLRVLFTFARECPPSRPDVLVVIISMLSSAPTPVTNIRFQAAVPKVGRLKSEGIRKDAEGFWLLSLEIFKYWMYLLKSLSSLGYESEVAASLQY